VSAELLRIKANSILRAGAPQAATAAEEHFLALARFGRASKVPCHGSCEHPQASRAYRQDQGRIAEARSLLQPVYDRFSEGFENCPI